MSGRGVRLHLPGAHSPPDRGSRRPRCTRETRHVQGAVTLCQRSCPVPSYEQPQATTFFFTTPYDPSPPLTNVCYLQPTLLLAAIYLPASITGSPLPIASPSSDFSLSPLSLSPSSGVPFSASPPGQSPLAAGNPLALSTSPQRLFDNTNPLSPRPEHLADLIQTFASHFSCFFAFFRLEDTMQRAREGRLLLHKSLGMAALASRYECTPSIVMCNKPAVTASHPHFISTRFSTLPDFVLEPRFQHGTAYLNVARVRSPLFHSLK